MANCLSELSFGKPFPVDDDGVGEPFFCFAVLLKPGEVEVVKDVFGNGFAVVHSRLAEGVDRGLAVGSHADHSEGEGTVTRAAGEAEAHRSYTFVFPVVTLSFDFPEGDSVLGCNLEANVACCD